MLEHKTNSAWSIIILMSAIFFSCTGCESVKYVDRPYPVEVPKLQFVPLDPELTDTCPNQPIVPPQPTIAQEREAAFAYQLVWAPCMLDKLASIRALQPQK